MITAVDTNVLSAIYDNVPPAVQFSQTLFRFAQDGPLVICGVVYAELLAGRGRSEADLDAFLQQVGVKLDADINADIWREAGRVNAVYHARRRAGGILKERPVLPDFLIGAHALHRADRLYTHDPTDFADFTTLTVVVP